MLQQGDLAAIKRPGPLDVSAVVVVITDVHIRNSFPCSTPDFYERHDIESHGRRQFAGGNGMEAAHTYVLQERKTFELCIIKLRRA